MLEEAKKQLEKEIRESIVFLREKNNTVPSETLEYMKVASLDKLQGKLRTEQEMHLNMQYYMEYCNREGYVTPMDWIKNHKHF